MKQATLHTASREETLSLATRFAKKLRGGEIIFLRGPIGAGKTVFVKGIAEALKLKSSPTSASFSLLKEYKNKQVRLFHIDLFRLEEGEVFNLGFEEMLEDERAIILAEWPDPIAYMLPADRLEINFILEGSDHRTIEVSSYGRVSDALLEDLCHAA
ncbi:MAG: tRNA (adenosine(37)-N6)-threonylcarbamoyltransferase complex ATPase subunit type 1 TsaE [Elusimicrobiaceae bacterium]|nr:tRNA (adenosine(37)-N6)-threonylcarbamoyltransferase complex ATPase subunit type 1 TsaE [Elusimicrobiaceae bacterium]